MIPSTSVGCLCFCSGRCSAHGRNGFRPSGRKELVDGKTENSWYYPAVWFVASPDNLPIPKIERIVFQASFLRGELLNFFGGVRFLPMKWISKITSLWTNKRLKRRFGNKKQHAKVDLQVARSENFPQMKKWDFSTNRDLYLTYLSLELHWLTCLALFPGISKSSKASLIQFPKKWPSLA